MTEYQDRYLSPGIADERIEMNALLRQIQSRREHGLPISYVATPFGIVCLGRLLQVDKVRLTRDVEPRIVAAEFAETSDDEWGPREDALDDEFNR